MVNGERRRWISIEEGSLGFGNCLVWREWMKGLHRFHKQRLLKCGAKNYF